MSTPPSGPPPGPPSSPKGKEPEADDTEDHPLSTNPGPDTENLHAALAASLSSLSTTDEAELAKAIELSRAEASLHSESVAAEKARM